MKTVEAEQAARVAALEAINRRRSLTDAESAEIERLIYADRQRAWRRHQQHNRRLRAANQARQGQA